MAVTDLNIIFQGKIGKAFLFHVISASRTYGTVTAGNIFVNLERGKVFWSGSRNFVPESEINHLLQMAKDDAQKIDEISK